MSSTTPVQTYRVSAYNTSKLSENKIHDDAVARMTAEIQASVKERKGSVQSPKQVVIADAVPVTALGKPDKKAVRAQFWAGSERSVG
mgnify:CR=1 FL=1